GPTNVHGAMRSLQMSRPRDTHRLPGSPSQPMRRVLSHKQRPRAHAPIHRLSLDKARKELQCESDLQRIGQDRLVSRHLLPLAETLRFYRCPLSGPRQLWLGLPADSRTPATRPLPPANTSRSFDRTISQQRALRSSKTIEGPAGLPFLAVWAQQYRYTVPARRAPQSACWCTSQANNPNWKRKAVSQW